MSKTLRVIDQFFEMEIGDIFTLSEDGTKYVFEHNEEYRKEADNSNGPVNSSYNVTFAISTEYAKELIREGYLEEVTDDKTDFVNVFDEIDKLTTVYADELHNMAENHPDYPECLKVEKTTVLTNLLKVLKHLKSLKK